MSAAALTTEDRATFAAIADILLPAHGRMPVARDADVADALLDAVVTHRPDIAEAMVRGLRLVAGMEGRQAAEHLLRQDGPAFDAVGLAASGAYFMSPLVREKLGYPGQESVGYDPHAVPEYETNGMLDRVRARGPIFRDTPKGS